MPVIKEIDGEYVYELEDDETLEPASDREDLESETELQDIIAVKSPTNKQFTRIKSNSIASPVRENSDTNKRPIIQSASSNASSFFYDPNNEPKDNCCLRRDCGSCPNVCHVILAISIGVSVLLVFGLIAYGTARQQDANINAPTGQKGNLVSEKCGSSRDCTFGAICVSGKCQCTAETYYDSYFAKCLPLKPYGESCLETRECNTFERLVCFNSFCTCPHQTIWANYYGTLECIRRREVGETCQETSHCVSTSECVSVSGTKRCSCNYGLTTLFLSGFSGQCETVRRVNERCFGWFQECPELTTCRVPNTGEPNYFCFCVDGYFYDSAIESCSVYRTINEVCNSSSTPCNSVVGLTCQSSTCSCLTTQYWNGTYCVTYRSYGQTCSSSTPCIKTDPNLVCGVPPNGVSQMMCYCNTNYFFSEYIQLCVLYNSEGSSCSESSECVSNALCTANTCNCYPGYYSNPANGACEVFLSFGDACSSSAGSKPCNYNIGLNCYGGICGCDPTYEYYNTFCYRRMQYLEACTTTNLCAAYRGLSCLSGTCNCPSPTTYSGTYNYCL